MWPSAQGAVSALASTTRDRHSAPFSGMMRDARSRSVRDEGSLLASSLGDRASVVAEAHRAQGLPHHFVWRLCRDRARAGDRWHRRADPLRPTPHHRLRSWSTLLVRRRQTSTSPAPTSEISPAGSAIARAARRADSLKSSPSSRLWRSVPCRSNGRDIRADECGRRAAGSGAPRSVAALPIVQVGAVAGVTARQRRRSCARLSHASREPGSLLRQRRCEAVAWLAPASCSLSAGWWPSGSVTSTGGPAMKIRSYSPLRCSRVGEGSERPRSASVRRSSYSAFLDSSSAVSSTLSDDQRRSEVPVARTPVDQGDCFGLEGWWARRMFARAGLASALRSLAWCCGHRRGLLVKAP